MLGNSSDARKLCAAGAIIPAMGVTGSSESRGKKRTDFKQTHKYFIKTHQHVI